MKPIWSAYLGTTALLFSTFGYASNGMNMIGYGARSLGMGGTGEATSSTSEAMNINPAGIAHIERREVAGGVSIMNPTLKHTDHLGNTVEDSLERPPIPYLAYSHAVGEFVFGAGIFLQGGLGTEYQGLVTPFSAMEKAGMLTDPANTIPPVDTIRTKMSHLKLTPTVAWKATDQLKLGATVNISYVQAELAMLPNTSVLADLDHSGTAGDSTSDMFSGLSIDNLEAYGVGLSVGFQYQWGDLSIGGSYTSKTKLDYENGSATMNMSAMGLGKVNYAAELDGISWPQEASMGLGYQVTPWLLVATDVSWIDWSSAIDQLNIRITDPDHPKAASSRDIAMEMNWQDQTVWEIGVELTPIENWAFRLGYNYGASPIKDEFLRAQFPAIGETHYTAGVGYSTNSWEAGFSLEHVPTTRKSNFSNNTAVNQFGPGSTESLSQTTLSLTIAKTF